MVEKIFKLKEHQTDTRTEIMAGITTFMTMAYILAVNPSILSAAGMDSGAVFTATCLSAAIGTILMAWLTNYPFALAPGMGLNAFFAYTVVLSMGYSWQFALAAVLVEGIIFIILSLTGVREAIFNSIPIALKHGVSAGIGFFIAFIGLLNAKIVQPSSATGVDLYAFATCNFREEGITVVLALIGIIITSILVLKKIRGGILCGILITWVIGMICQAVGLYAPNPEIGMYSLFPNFANWQFIPSIQPTVGGAFAGFALIKDHMLDFVVVMFSFLFVDIFDTLGTVIGLATRANMLDKEGKLPRISSVLLVDAIATTLGAILGTSTTTTFVESSAGVSEGGKTGLTSITTGALFIVALVLSPIFLAIPSFATAPALVIVGFLMVGAILKIDFDNIGEAIPAYLTVVFMAFAYSIADGIAMGIISYTVINAANENTRKKVTVLMYVLTVIFVLKYALL